MQVKLANAGARTMRSFSALERRSPGFAALDAEQAARRLSEMLLPGYEGPERMAEAEWAAEARAIFEAIASGTGSRRGACRNRLQRTR